MNHYQEKKKELLQVMHGKWGPESSGEPIRMHVAQQMLLLYCLSDYEFLQRLINENLEARLRWLLRTITA